MMKSIPVLLMFLVGILFLVILTILSFEKSTIVPILYVGPFVVLGFFICPVIFYYRQKKAYNNGICPKCGGPLKYFGSDHGGGNGYCCENCHDYYIWIDWFTPDEKEE